MAENIGAQFVSPQYWPQQIPQGWWQQQQQQQPWGGQMGTRGLEGQQLGGVQGQQPMGVQGGLQGQVGMPQAGFGMPQQVGGIAPHERAVLRGVLDILREGRVALASGAIDAQVAQRLTGAHAFLCGFLEGKGQAELGSFLRTIPPLTTRGSVLGDPQYDDMVNGLEAILSEGAETRFGFGDVFKVFKKVVDAAPSIWKAGREIGRLVR